MGGLAFIHDVSQIRNILQAGESDLSARLLLRSESIEDLSPELIPDALVPGQKIEDGAE